MCFIDVFKTFYISFLDMLFVLFNIWMVQSHAWSAVIRNLLIRIWIQKSIFIGLSCYNNSWVNEWVSKWVSEREREREK